MSGCVYIKAICIILLSLFLNKLKLFNLFLSGNMFMG